MDATTLSKHKIAPGEKLYYGEHSYGNYKVLEFQIKEVGTNSIAGYIRHAYTVTWNAGTKTETKYNDEWKEFQLTDIGQSLYFKKNEVGTSFKVLSKEPHYKAFEEDLKADSISNHYDSTYVKELQSFMPPNPISGSDIKNIILGYNDIELQKKEEKAFAESNCNGSYFARLDVRLDLSDNKDVINNLYYFNLYLSKDPSGPIKTLKITDPIWKLYAGFTSDSDYHWNKKYKDTFDKIDYWSATYMDCGNLIDWRAPIAELYYKRNLEKLEFNYTHKFFNAHKNEEQYSTIADRLYTLKDLIYKYSPLLRRQFNSGVCDFSDDYSIDSSMHEDVKIDDFLLTVLKERRNNSELLDIILTIQGNQYDIINALPFKNHITQGCAGSGKTMILLHRISYIMYNYNLDSKSILILTPNELFIQYLHPLIESLGLKNITCISSEQFIWNIIESYGLDKNSISSILVEKYNIAEILKSDFQDKFISIYETERHSIYEMLLDERFYAVQPYYQGNMEISENITLKALLNSTSNIMNSVLNDIHSTNNAINSYLETTKDRKKIIDNYEAIIEHVIKDSYKVNPLKIFNYENIAKEEKESLSKLSEKDFKDCIKYLKQEYDSISKIYTEASNPSNILQHQLYGKSIEGFISNMRKALHVQDAHRKLYNSINRACFINRQSPIHLEEERSKLNRLLKKNQYEDTISAAKILLDKYVLCLDKVNDIYSIYKMMIFDDIIADYDNAALSQVAENSINYLNAQEILDRIIVNQEYIATKLPAYQKHANRNNELIKHLQPKIDTIKAKSGRNTGLTKKILSGEIDISKYIDSITSWQNDWANINPIDLLCNCCRKSGLCETGIPNNTSILFLFAMCYGFEQKNNATDSLVFIDEGQELSTIDYSLLKLYTGETSYYNIYGDIHQRNNQIGIDNWNKLESLFNFESHELNENYRNTSEITEYCNRELNTNMISVGLNGNPVRTISRSNLDDFIESTNDISKTTAIIVKNQAEAMSFARHQNIIINSIETGKISVMTVLESKGLEFNNVFILDEGMSERDKYISYTRALSNLIIVKND